MVQPTLPVQRAEQALLDCGRLGWKAKRNVLAVPPILTVDGALTARWFR
ncbi:MAG: hypothetical protein IKU86_09545 [Thermoguttaceae bacterium]|nr:hypothetical protein [Thermoguttaceae bacterium]